MPEMIAPAAARPPPRSDVGVLGWLRHNLFSSPLNAVLTVIGLWLTTKVAWTLFDWAILRAVWTGVDGAACNVEGAGACWPFIKAKFGLFMYGRYPDAERWRVDLTYVLAAAGLVPLLAPGIPHKGWSALFTLVVFPVKIGRASCRERVLVQV